MSLATRRQNQGLPFLTRVRNTCWTILEWVLLFVLFVFVPLGLVSLPLSVCWQAQDLTNRTGEMNLDDRRALTVDYPAIVLIDDKPALFSFSLHQPITQPLTVTVQLDRALVLAIPPQTYRDDEPVLTFQPQASRVQTQTLPIANARLVDGLGQTGAVTLTITGSSSPITETLTIGVEGTLRAALRGLVGNSLNWIVTALLSAAGLVFTLFEKRRETEEKKEAEKREQAKQERERFRNLMQQQNTHLAQETIAQLEKQGLAQYLAPGDLAWMHRLVDWSKGNLAKLDFKTVPPDWLDAAAGALIFARENGRGNDQEVLSALRQLPVNELSDDLQGVVQITIHLPEQERRWPLRPAEPNWNLIALNQPWQDHLGVNPFPYEYAEDDAIILFCQEVGAFWDEHSLYQRIKATNKSEIIAGEAGTGKTAMALALGEYLHNAETLACYLPGLPDEREMQRALAKKILDFVCWHPTFLRKLGQDSRVSLARVCADALGDQIVLAKLDTAAVQQMEFVKQAQNEQDSKRRENIVRSQLRLFRETVVSLPARERLSHRKCYGALAQCARSLDFRLPIRVVIDASGEKCAEWMNEFILPRLQLWRMDEIIVKIFVPASASNAIQFPEDHLGWLLFSELEWDASLLTQMLEHRFNSIMAARGSRVVRPGVVDEHLWNRMIESAKNNPRCFIRLWNRMLAIAANGVLDETILGRALEGLECP
jgi:cell division protein FtsL